MRPYGSRRTYAKCRTIRCNGKGGKVHVELTLKNHKTDRAAAKQELRDIEDDHDSRIISDKS